MTGCIPTTINTVADGVAFLAGTKTFVQKSAPGLSNEWGYLSQQGQALTGAGGAASLTPTCFVSDVSNFRLQLRAALGGAQHAYCTTATCLQAAPWGGPSPSCLAPSLPSWFWPAVAIGGGTLLVLLVLHALSPPGAR